MVDWRAGNSCHRDGDSPDCRIGRSSSTGIQSQQSGGLLGKTSSPTQMKSLQTGGLEGEESSATGRESQQAGGLRGEASSAT